MWTVLHDRTCLHACRLSEAMDKTIMELNTQLDFVSISKDGHEEEAASTPSFSGYNIKKKTAEECFSTGETHTSPTDAATTPRQMPSTEPCSGSQMKTPRVSNMRHLLGNLSDDLASPEQALQQRTPGHTRTPTRQPPLRVPVNDSSSSSSGMADSSSVSGTASESSEGYAIAKAAYKTTATSRNTAPAMKPPRKTRGTQQAAVASCLLSRLEHSKPQAPHAITQLRESDRQHSFEFPAICMQQDPASRGVIWKLDTPAEHEIPHQNTSAAVQIQQVPASNLSASALNSAFPPQLHGSFMQPQTTQHYQGMPMGQLMGGGSIPFSPHAAMHHQAVSFTNSQGMQLLPPCMSAGMVRFLAPCTCPPFALLCCQLMLLDAPGRCLLKRSLLM